MIAETDGSFHNVVCFLLHSVEHIFEKTLEE